MNDYGAVYIIKNDINNKVYIGQTTQKINNRLRQHKYYSKTGTTHLANAINKYGEEFFHIKLIRNCSDQEELNYYEEEYIKLFNSIKKGYNLDQVIRGGGLRSEETKLRMKESQNRRPFNVYDLDGNFIGFYKNQRIAENELGIGLNQVNLCLNGAMNRSGNYIFLDIDKDTEENRTLTIKIALNTYQNHLPKPIKVFLKTDGTFIGDFENANLFAKKYNLDPSMVAKVAKTKNAYVKDYLIIYTEDYTKELLEKRLKELKPKRLLKRGGLIHCNNGKTYSSRIDACYDLNISQSQICRILHNDMPNQKIKLWITYE
jgi:group I intron endonuclease